MSTLEEIKTAVIELPDNERQKFYQWIDELGEAEWDREFEEDVKAGRLDELGDKAERDFHSGKCRDL